MAHSKRSDGERSRLYQRLSLPTEIDLHGMTVHAALEALDRYLNDATVLRMPSVRVIHGKGTGTLKAAVLGYLADHPLVARHYEASPSEGDGGVTIAVLQ
jgi:DNA mismatch repair protein MutS2